MIKMSFTEKKLGHFKLLISQWTKEGTYVTTTYDILL